MSMPLIPRRTRWFGFLTGVLALVASATAADASSATPAPVYQPVADPAAIVTVGRVRFTFLTARLVRLEWAADGRFEDHASLVFLNRRMSIPALETTRNGNDVVVKTGALTVSYSPEPGTDGRFTAENLKIVITVNGRPVEWRPGAAATGNLLGTTRTLDGARGSMTREPIEPGLISRDGWAVVDDSTRPLFDTTTFDGDANQPWPWVQARPPGERQDWYFFGYGHDYKAALHDFTRVAGPIPLPPRFAFGVWWSRYWAYSDQELDELVTGFHTHDVPLDVLVIDMDWHLTFGNRNEKDASGNRKGWTGYTWNRQLFPEPERFLHHLHDEGLKVSLNLHPASGIQPWEEHYPEMARAMGVDPATKQYIPFEITDRTFARNYFDVIHHPLERQGVDFWWLDWQQKPTTAIAGLSPTWWLNYVHFTDQERQGKRPLLFHRWGGLGNHRYQIGFSGDTISVWESLAFQPWFTATAANVGYAYWSHDIGGHMPGVVDPELYLRWIQFGVFSPILRTHTTKNPDAERRIWAYPEPYADLMRSAFELRRSLVPYLYTEARKTYESGVAFIRPLYYDWPEADDAYTAKNEYGFGDQVLVAPVTAPAAPTGLAGTSVWLPPGEWIEWPTGRHFEGPRRVTRLFSIDQVPVYVRPGAIVPMARPDSPSQTVAADPLLLTVFPLADGQGTSYRVYEDDGIGVKYQEGICRWIPVEAQQRGDELTVHVKVAEGALPPNAATRRYELRLPADWPPESVTVNGRSISLTTGDEPGWCYEGNAATTVIKTGPLATTADVTIHVRRSAGSIGRRAVINGLAGALTRLRGAYTALMLDHPHVTPPDALVEAYQTGRRLSYHPEEATRETANLWHQLGAVRESIAPWVSALAEPDETIASKTLHLKADLSPAAKAGEVARFRAAVRTAAAALDDISVADH